MIVFERAVRFDEVDAAGLVFFATIVGYAHEAMEQLFAGVDGGYPGLILGRRVGFPAVRLDCEFSAPLRYGDRLFVETWVARIGGRSADLVYRMRRGDGVLAATLRHTLVTTDLDRVASCDMPSDVRRLLETHLETAEGATGR
jgi:4-hydroxybenzoyl-CoA thioesterase